MPSIDDRLRDALRAGAREPSGDDVFARVHAKRARRQLIRRVEVGAGAALLVTALVAVGVTALDRSDTDRQVAVRPSIGTAPVVRSIDGVGLPRRRATVRRVSLDPDEGYVRGPLVTARGGITLAAYDRSGASFTFPPSRILRVDQHGEVTDRVDLQGEILSLADGEGARWALTRDKTVIGPQDPEFRVKRIAADGGYLSNPVPPPEQPVGPIVASGGGVWVPVRDGVLRFDVVTGAFAAKIPLSTVTDHRAVASFGKGVAVTDGTEILRLDPASDRPSPLSFAVPNELPAGSEYIDLIGTGRGTVALAREAQGTRWLIRFASFDSQSTIDSPIPGMTPERVLLSGDDVMVVGHVGRRLTLYRYSKTNGHVRQTVTIGNIVDADVVSVDATSAFITSRGSLYRVHLPS